MSNEKTVMLDLQGAPRMLRNKIKVYPIKLKDALDFYECITVLNIPKDSTNDVEIIKMSYLKFLILISSSKELQYLRDRLFELLKLIFRTDDVEIGVKFDGQFHPLSKNPDHCFMENVEFAVVVDGQIELSEFDFSKIKTLISEQNMIDIEDDNVHPEVRKKLEEAKAFMAKRGNKVAPIDERILAYQYEMKLTLNEVFDMTLYQFNRGLESINHIKNSDMIQHARFSGMVTVKDEAKLPTWLSAIERNKEDPLKLDAEKLTNQMKQTLK